MALTLAAQTIKDATEYGWKVETVDVERRDGQSRDVPTRVFVLTRGEQVERIPVVDAVRDGDGYRFVRGSGRAGTGSTGEMIEIDRRVRTNAPAAAPATARTRARAASKSAAAAVNAAADAAPVVTRTRKRAAAAASNGS